LNRRRVARVQREVHAAIDDGRAEWILVAHNDCLGGAMRKRHGK
jgi:hypothetical protein